LIQDADFKGRERKPAAVHIENFRYLCCGAKGAAMQGTDGFYTAHGATPAAASRTGFIRIPVEKIQAFAE
jgi:hypothetical protein